LALLWLKGLALPWLRLLVALAKWLGYWLSIGLAATKWLRLAMAGGLTLARLGFG